MNKIRLNVSVQLETFEALETMRNKLKITRTEFIVQAINNMIRDLHFEQEIDEIVNRMYKEQQQKQYKKIKEHNERMKNEK